MKKLVLLLSVLFISSSIILAQEIIENPEKPLNKNAGRVIQLKEVMRITDVEGKYFFSSPWDIKVAKDGSIFVHEPNKLYKFDANGKFVKNFYKKGEGPGELNQNLTDVVIVENEIVLASSNMYKIIRLDMHGNLIQDIRPEWRFSALVGYCDGRYYLTQRERKSFKRASGMREDNLRLCVVSNTGEIAPTPYIFPITILVHFSKKSSGRITISRIQTVSENQRYVYVFHTPEYLVKLLDLEKIEVIRRFRRKYSRVKLEMKRETSLPMPKFCNDICRLLIYKNNLWVVTSTFDKEKGILVDVFNKEGKYLDNFYLPLFRIKTEGRIQYYARIAIHRDYLFIIEEGEDDLISIAKYEIID